MLNGSLIDLGTWGVGWCWFCHKNSVVKEPVGAFTCANPECGRYNRADEGQQQVALYLRSQPGYERRKLDELERRIAALEVGVGVVRANDKEAGA